MEFCRITSKDDLTSIIRVLNDSHETVANEFGFTIQDNPTNNAFISKDKLKTQLDNGIKLFLLKIKNIPVGCVAIEIAEDEIDCYYIEKLSVIPDYRHLGVGVELMNFATSKVKINGGKVISIALIDSNLRLKNWYIKQGFKETGTKNFSQLPFKVCFMKKQL